MTTPRTTQWVHASEAEALAEQLEDWLTRLKKFASIARKQPEERLAVYNWASVPKGMQLVGSFVQKADESRIAAELGRPIAIGQLKPRSTAKNNPPTIEEAKAIAKERRNSKKKS